MHRTALCLLHAVRQAILNARQLDFAFTLKTNGFSAKCLTFISLATTNIDEIFPDFILCSISMNDKICLVKVKYIHNVRHSNNSGILENWFHLKSCKISDNLQASNLVHYSVIMTASFHNNHKMERCLVFKMKHWESLIH